MLYKVLAHPEPPLSSVHSNVTFWAASYVPPSGFTSVFGETLSFGGGGGGGGVVAGATTSLGGGGGSIAYTAALTGSLLPALSIL